MSIVFDDSRNLPPEELRPSVAETEVSQFTSPPRISTDFLPATKTSEPVHQRKWPVSLTTEVFVRKFKSQQDGLIFHPHGNNVQTLKHPSAYEELDGHGVTERTLVTEKKMYNIIPSASITLWERQGDPDKPDVIFITGRKGHVADMGELPQEVKGYNRNTNL